MEQLITSMWLMGFLGALMLLGSCIVPFVLVLIYRQVRALNLREERRDVQRVQDEHVERERLKAAEYIRQVAVGSDDRYRPKGSV